MSVDDVRWYRRLPRPDVTLEVSRLEGALWVIVACSLIGDVVTTFVGLHLGLVESNPVAHGAIEGYGMIGMLALKAGALAVAVCCRFLLPRAYTPIVPAGLALPWIAAVCVNLYAISVTI